MKQTKTKKGYLQIQLSYNKKIKTVFVHRLVAEAFIPNPENKPQVNHINGIKTDNRVENLEWSTNSENIKHAYDNGLLSKIGEKHSNNKLNENKVLTIRKLFKNGLSPLKIAKKYGVSRSCIYHVIKYNTWKHI